MAHSRIFEITTKQLDRVDYLDLWSLEPEQYSDFADYIDDMNHEGEENSIEWFADVMSDIFDCDGRELTLRDISGFIEKWKAEVKKRASEFDPKGDGMSSYFLLKSIKRTHKGIDFHFYNEDYGLMDPCQLIEDILLSHKPGDKFYIGGILDYHW